MITQDTKKRPKVINFTPSMKADIEEVAAVEGRTETDVVREAVRRYIKQFKDQQRRQERLQTTAR